MTKSPLIKKKMGQPTKYGEDTTTKVVEYIALCTERGTDLPTIDGLALHLGIDDTTINNWCKVYPEFKTVVDNLKRIQKQILINKGVFGGRNENIAMLIFLLKVNHGMIEGNKLDVTSSGKPLPTPIMKVDLDVH